MAGHPLLPGHLRTERVNRHTFCGGRNGPDRTHALRFLLERLIAAAPLRTVVLDLAGDLLGPGPLAPAGVHERHTSRRDVVHLRPHSARRPLRIRFTDLSVRSRAAVLELDPATDRAELNSLIHVWSEGGAQEPDALGPTLRTLGTDAAHRVADRVEALGLSSWRAVWSSDEPSATDVLDERPSAAVLGLAGYATEDQRLTVALAVLDHLLTRRGVEEQVLVVLNGAQDACPPEPGSAVGRAVRNRVVQLALEGHRRGLWLLVAAPGPSDVHRGVLTRCTNLLLTRGATPVDLADLGSAFPHVPAEALARGAHLGPGEALAAGPFVHRPAVVDVRERGQRRGSR